MEGVWSSNEIVAAHGGVVRSRPRVSTEPIGGIAEDLGDTPIVLTQPQRSWPSDLHPGDDDAIFGLSNADRPTELYGGPAGINGNTSQTAARTSSFDVLMRFAFKSFATTDRFNAAPGEAGASSPLQMAQAQNVAAPGSELLTNPSLITSTAFSALLSYARLCADRRAAMAASPVATHAANLDGYDPGLHLTARPPSPAELPPLAPVPALPARCPRAMLAAEFCARFSGLRAHSRHPDRALLALVPGARVADGAIAGVPGPHAPAHSFDAALAAAAVAIDEASAAGVMRAGATARHGGNLAARAWAWATGAADKAAVDDSTGAKASTTEQVGAEDTPAWALFATGLRALMRRSEAHAAAAAAAVSASAAADAPAVGRNDSIRGATTDDDENEDEDGAASSLAANIDGSSGDIVCSAHGAVVAGFSPVRSPVPDPGSRVECSPTDAAPAGAPTAASTADAALPAGASRARELRRELRRLRARTAGAHPLRHAADLARIRAVRLELYSLPYSRSRADERARLQERQRVDARRARLRVLPDWLRETDTSTHAALVPPTAKASPYLSAGAGVNAGADSTGSGTDPDEVKARTDARRALGYYWRRHEAESSSDATRDFSYSGGSFKADLTSDSAYSADELGNSRNRCNGASESVRAAVSPQAANVHRVPARPPPPLPPLAVLTRLNRTSRAAAVAVPAFTLGASDGDIASAIGANTAAERESLAYALLCFPAASLTPAFLALPRATLALLLRCDALNTGPGGEFALFQALVRWARFRLRAYGLDSADPALVRLELHDLLPLLRFNALSPTEAARITGGVPLDEDFEGALFARCADASVGAMNPVPSELSVPTERQSLWQQLVGVRVTSVAAISSGSVASSADTPASVFLPQFTPQRPSGADGPDIACAGAAVDSSARGRRSLFTAAETRALRRLAAAGSEWGSVSRHAAAGAVLAAAVQTVPRAAHAGAPHRGVGGGHDRNAGSENSNEDGSESGSDSGANEYPATVLDGVAFDDGVAIRRRLEPGWRYGARLPFAHLDVRAAPMLRARRGWLERPRYGRRRHDDGDSDESSNEMYTNVVGHIRGDIGAWSNDSSTSSTGSDSSSRSVDGSSSSSSSSSEGDSSSNNSDSSDGGAVSDGDDGNDNGNDVGGDFGSIERGATGGNSLGDAGGSVAGGSITRIDSDDDDDNDEDADADPFRNGLRRRHGRGSDGGSDSGSNSSHSTSSSRSGSFDSDSRGRSVGSRPRVQRTAAHVRAQHRVAVRLSRRRVQEEARPREAAANAAANAAVSAAASAAAGDPSAQIALTAVAAPAAAQEAAVDGARAERRERRWLVHGLRQFARDSGNRFIQRLLDYTRSLTDPAQLRMLDGVPHLASFFGPVRPGRLTRVDALQQPPEDPGVLRAAVLPVISTASRAVERRFAVAGDSTGDAEAVAAGDAWWRSLPEHTPWPLLALGDAASLRISVRPAAAGEIAATAARAPPVRVLQTAPPLPPGARTRSCAGQDTVSSGVVADAGTLLARARAPVPWDIVRSRLSELRVLSRRLHALRVRRFERLLGEPGRRPEPDERPQTPPESDVEMAHARQMMRTGRRRFIVLHATLFDPQASRAAASLMFDAAVTPGDVAAISDGPAAPAAAAFGTASLGASPAPKLASGGASAARAPAATKVKPRQYEASPAALSHASPVLISSHSGASAPACTAASGRLPVGLPGPPRLVRLPWLTTRVSLALLMTAPPLVPPRRQRRPSQPSVRQDEGAPKAAVRPISIEITPATGDSDDDDDAGDDTEVLASIWVPGPSAQPARSARALLTMRSDMCTVPTLVDFLHRQQDALLNTNVLGMLGPGILFGWASAWTVWPVAAQTVLVLLSFACSAARSLVRWLVPQLRVSAIDVRVPPSRSSLTIDSLVTKYPHRVPPLPEMQLRALADAVATPVTGVTAAPFVAQESSLSLGRALPLAALACEANAVAAVSAGWLALTPVRALLLVFASLASRIYVPVLKGEPWAAENPQLKPFSYSLFASLIVSALLLCGLGGGFVPGLSVTAAWLPGFLGLAVNCGLSLAACRVPRVERFIALTGRVFTPYGSVGGVFAMLIMSLSARTLLAKCFEDAAPNPQFFGPHFTTFVSRYTDALNVFGGDWTFRRLVSAAWAPLELVGALWRSPAPGSDLPPTGVWGVVVRLFLFAFRFVNPMRWALAVWNMPPLIVRGSLLLYYCLRFVFISSLNDGPSTSDARSPFASKPFAMTLYLAHQLRARFNVAFPDEQSRPFNQA